MTRSARVAASSREARPWVCSHSGSASAWARLATAILPASRSKVGSANLGSLFSTVYLPEQEPGFRQDLIHADAKLGGDHAGGALDGQRHIQPFAIATCTPNSL